MDEKIDERDDFLETLRSVPGLQPEHVPPLSREIAEIAGLDAAMEISLQWGGRKMIFSACAEALQKMIGEAQAQRLCGTMAGEQIEIPLAHRALAFWMRSRGHSLVDIRSRLRVSRRCLNHWRLR